MMLTFKTPYARAVKTEWVEFRGSEIRISTGPNPIAHYVAGHWIHNGARSSDIEWRVMLTMHFEDQVRSACAIVGPYFGMSVQDRFLFGDTTHVATLSPSAESWLRYRTMESWPVVRVLEDRPQGQYSD